jgi:hypothetical protein
MKKAYRITPFSLGLIHRLIGLLQNLIGRLTAIRKQSNTDTRRAMVLEIVEKIWSV